MMKGARGRGSLLHVDRGRDAKRPIMRGSPWEGARSAAEQRLTAGGLPRPGLSAV